MNNNKKRTNPSKNSLFIYACLLLLIAALMTGCGSQKSSAPAAENTASSTDNDDALADSPDAASDNTEFLEDADSSPDGGDEDIPSQETADSDSSDVVDLTRLSSTMVYSEVYNMMYTPEDYIGKTVKMKGSFAVYDETDQNYYACVIADAAACCSQGIEFVWKGDHSYPEDYPEVGSDITVEGTFETYEEDGYTYCHLTNAEMMQ